MGLYSQIANLKIAEIEHDRALSRGSQRCSTFLNLRFALYDIVRFLKYVNFCIFVFTQSPYGESVEPEKAPEAISKAVASLPPEQMFELMKQMKVVKTCC